jgi:deoxyribonuclease-4
MRIGAHLRTSKGIVSAAERAHEIGCEAMQIFAANPSAWQSRDIDPGVAARFRESTAGANLLPVTIHTQYLINLASPDPDIYRRSSLALADSMTRGHALGARYVVTHIGSHRGTGFSEGLTRICQAVDEAFAADHEEVLLLLENSAGAGDSVGSDFAELEDDDGELPF